MLIKSALALAAGVALLTLSPPQASAQWYGGPVYGSSYGWDGYRHHHRRWGYERRHRYPPVGRFQNYRSSGVTFGSYACERDPAYRQDPRCLNR